MVILCRLTLDFTLLCDCLLILGIISHHHLEEQSEDVIILIQEKRSELPEIPMSYPKIEPPVAATMQAMITYEVTLPRYSSALSFATPAGVKGPPAIFQSFSPSPIKPTGKPREELFQPNLIKLARLPMMYLRLLVC